MTKPVSVLFVCIGNICRSPTAEGVFQSMVTKAGLAERITVDSAGMSNYHVGQQAHGPSREAASKRGYSLQSRARQFTPEDFSKFDYILPMDSSNIPPMMAMASSDEEKKKIIPFISLIKNEAGYTDVPDPYFGGRTDFDLVLNICEEGCETLIKKIEREKF